jgi:hypothetical protein
MGNGIDEREGEGEINSTTFMFNVTENTSYCPSKACSGPTQLCLPV